MNEFVPPGGRQPDRGVRGVSRFPFAARGPSDLPRRMSDAKVGQFPENQGDHTHPVPNLPDAVSPAARPQETGTPLLQPVEAQPAREKRAEVAEPTRPWEQSYGDFCDEPITLYRGMRAVTEEEIAGHPGEPTQRMKLGYRLTTGEPIPQGDHGNDWSPYPNTVSGIFSDGVHVYKATVDREALRGLIDEEVTLPGSGPVFHLTRSPNNVTQLSPEEIAEHKIANNRYGAEAQLYIVEQKLDADTRLIYRPVAIWLESIQAALARGDHIPPNVMEEYISVRALRDHQRDAYEAEKNHFREQRARTDEVDMQAWGGSPERLAQWKEVAAKVDQIGAPQFPELWTSKTSMERPLDPGIKGVVTGLHAHGFQTTMSCEGHFSGSPLKIRTPYVLVGENLDRITPDSEIQARNAQALESLQRLVDRFNERNSDSHIAVARYRPSLAHVNTLGIGDTIQNHYEVFDRSANVQSYVDGYRHDMYRFGKFLKREFLTS